MFTFFRIFGIWILCLFYSLMSIYIMFISYVIKFPSRPWKSKDHSVEPDILKNFKLVVHKNAKLNGLHFHYVEAGNRSNPLMLFVHGIPEFWFSWREQIPNFSRDFWTVAIDMRGFNLSDRPKGICNYKLKDCVEDLRSLLEHLDRKQCILICHGFGASIGREFVSKYRSMVEKYVFIGSPSSHVFGEAFRTSIDQFQRSWFIVFAQMPFLPEALMSTGDFASFSVIWNTPFSLNLTEEYLEAYRYVYSKPGACTSATNYYRANLYDLLLTSRDECVTIDGFGGLFIVGEHDQYNTLTTLLMTAKKYPQIRIKTVPNASHFAHQDHPKHVNRLIRQFLGPASNFSVRTIS